MTNETIQMLVRRALEARDKSYAPYSGFAVGAALLAADGACYTGANIESASYSPTVCAERVAFFTAIHQGERRFRAIAIVGGAFGQDVTAFCSPCGVCRQVMAEFCDEDFLIVLFDGKKTETHTLGELFPHSFRLK